MSLARAVGLSTSHFCRRFKAAFSRTPMAYPERVRMGEAGQLIRNGDLPIKEVTRKVGYRDPNYFSTAFKRFYGSPPQSHRLDASSP